MVARYLFYVCLLLGFMPLRAGALEIMLPQVYTEKDDIRGWLVSEKLDGVRGYWDGERLRSKNGFEFKPPPEFIRGLPSFALEGELWAGRGRFEETLSIVGKGYPHAGWLGLQFAIFDVPEHPGSTVQRLAVARKWFVDHPSSFAFVIAQNVLENRDQLNTELHRVEALGGEGLIVRKADSLYHSGRSVTILKVKSFFDMEAVVLAHIGGKGRNEGRLGALLVETSDNIRFKIGTGFSDVERGNPPPVGAVITFKYYGFFKSGKPKFPSFLRVREPLD